MQHVKFVLDFSVSLQSTRPENYGLFYGIARSTAAISEAYWSHVNKELSETQRTRIGDLFRSVRVLPFFGDDAILARIAEVRTDREEMASLDVAAAATALCHGLPLMTCTPDIFRPIKGLLLLQPLANSLSEPEEWPSLETPEKPALLLDHTVVARAIETGDAELNRFQSSTKLAMSVASFGHFHPRTMSASERAKFDALVWGRIDILDLDESVGKWIPVVREHRDMPSRDAVVAATALLHDRTLVTYSPEAFEGIAGLRVRDAAIAAT